MRLTCPNCAAQYEVDAAVIPETGRDVQCSSCGHIWFEMPSLGGDAPPVAAPPVPAQHPQTAPRPVARTDAGDAAPAPAEPEAAGAADEPDRPAPASIPPADDDDPGPAAAPVAPPRRRSLDDAVLEVLREEAERESRARKAEAGTLESQGDLGLSAPQPVVPRPVRPVLPRTQAGSHARPPASGGVPSEDTPQAERTGRHRLPDIEEINSSLGGLEGAESPPGSVPPVAQRARGFRLGFGLVLGLSLAALLVYGYAPRIAAAAPDLAPTLDSYVAGVDTLRLSLDGLAQSATNAIRGLSAAGG